MYYPNLHLAGINMRYNNTNKGLNGFLSLLGVGKLETMGTSRQASAPHTPRREDSRLWAAEWSRRWAT